MWNQGLVTALLVHAVVPHSDLLSRSHEKLCRLHFELPMPDLLHPLGTEKSELESPTVGRGRCPQPNTTYWYSNFASLELTRLELEFELAQLESLI